MPLDTDRSLPRPFLFFVFRWLHSVALALWLGGLIVIGALVAPTAFHVIPNAPALAGALVGDSLRKFNVLCLICGAVMLLANGVLWNTRKRAALICAALVISLLVLTAYLGWSLFPSMDAAQVQGHMVLFDRLHHRYERLSGGELPLLLLLVGAATLRDNDYHFL